MCLRELLERISVRKKSWEVVMIMKGEFVGSSTAVAPVEKLILGFCTSDLDSAGVFGILVASFRLCIWLFGGLVTRSMYTHLYPRRSLKNLISDPLSSIP